MSPRDAELLAAARARLRGVRRTLEDDVDEPDLAVGAAYYAVLLAARAALSSRDLYAKTRSGTWSLFSRELVRDGSVDAALAKEAAAMQHAREQVDYEAVSATRLEAERMVAVAERFVGAIEALLTDG